MSALACSQQLNEKVNCPRCRLHGQVTESALSATNLSGGNGTRWKARGSGLVSFLQAEEQGTYPHTNFTATWPRVLTYAKTTIFPPAVFRSIVRCASTISSR